MTIDPTPTLSIDLEALVANWRDLRARHGGAVAGVVKADGYGLGAAPVARALFDAGCRHFFTATEAEALALRARLPAADAMIAPLDGPSMAPGEYERVRLTPVLNTLNDVARWADWARGSGHPAAAILHIDTGMNRLGLSRAELDRLVSEPSSLDGLDPRFVMTHLVAAETPDAPSNHAQLARFHAAHARLPPAPISIANSSGIFLGPAFRSDLARPGAALYGVNPTPGTPNPMRPVVTLRAPVIALRDVAAGETVGYAGDWTAPCPSRIATVGLGYADGFPRSLGNRALAFFDGRPVRLVGRVSMDLTTYDVTDVPIGLGGALELIGPHVPVDAVAKAAGTTGYEILTSLGRRYRRVHLGA